ncbi:FtsK/SpoIIIE domain-containing protein [Rothia sp. CCM 9418]|uniref:FtsK/SpoIIIE domain-containing protein n=1 Tax=Rothia sp. CCM 9418 TaxID=3402661 RepID=UPI003ADB07C8
MERFFLIYHHISGTYTPIYVETTEDTCGASLQTVLEQFSQVPPLYLHNIALSKVADISSLPSGTILSTQPEKTPHPSKIICYLCVENGPDCGMIYPLTRGTYIIGRSDCDITIKDMALSPHHGKITISPTQLFFHNQSRPAIPLSLNTPFRIGNSFCVLTQDLSCRHSTLTPEILAPLEITPPVTAKHTLQRALMTLLPLAIGVLIAWLMHTWIFLLFSAATSVLMGVHWVKSRHENTQYREFIQNKAQEDAKQSNNVHHAGCPGYRPEHQPRILCIGKTQRYAALTHKSAPLTRLPFMHDIGFFLRYHEEDTVHIYTHTAAGTLRSLLIQICSQHKHAIVFTPEFIHEYPEEYALLKALTLIADTDTKTPHKPWVIAIYSSEQPYRVQKEKNYLFICTTEKTLSPTPYTSEKSITLRQQNPYTPLLTAYVPNCFSRQLPEHDQQAITVLANQMSIQSFANSISRQLQQHTQYKRQISSSSIESFPLFTQVNSTNKTAEGGIPLEIEVLIGVVDGKEHYLGLNQDGPHWLIAGTTGSGKSHLLRALLLSMVYRYAPERLGLILIDFKGGSTFSPFAQIPHTRAFLTDLDSSSVQRAFLFIRAELQRREEYFATLGVSSYSDYIGQYDPNSQLLPELIIVIDEYKMLIDAHPEAHAHIVTLATIGRSLGVHLILATQRPQGSVASDIRANITTTLCLRVSSAQESMSLINSDAASKISTSTPGAGFIYQTDEQLLPFQGVSIDVPASAPKPPLHIQYVGSSYQYPFPAEQSHDEDTILRSYLKNLEDEKTFTSPILPSPEKHSLHYKNSRPQEYFAGILELPAQGAHHRLQFCSEEGTYALIGAPDEKETHLYSFLRQGAQMGAELYVFTADTRFYEKMKALQGQGKTPRFTVLTSPYDPEFLRHIIEYLMKHPPQDSPQVILFDALDLWLENYTRERSLENLILALLLEQIPQRTVLVTAHQMLKGRFSNIARTSLYSAHTVEHDPLRAHQRHYPVPGSEQFTVEGEALHRIKGAENVKAGLFYPSYCSYEELEQELPIARPLFTQVPEHICWERWEEGLKDSSHYPDDKHLAVGMSTTQDAVSIAIESGQYTPIVGGVRSGKTNALRVLHNSNRDYDSLLIHGQKVGSVQEVKELLEKISEPEQLILFVDDAHYLSAEAQNILIDFSAQAQHIFCVYSAEPRWSHTPLALACKTAKQGILLQPQGHAELQFYPQLRLPYNVMTEGKIPPGRAVIIEPYQQFCCQLPLATEDT